MRVRSGHLIGLAVTLLLGCSTKKALEGATDELLGALGEGSYARFKAMAHPALVEQIPEAKFAAFSQVVKQLGALGGRSMTGLSVQLGGGQQASYALQFAGGEVKLGLTLTEGKLTAFNLSGEAVTKAQRAAANEAYATYRVASFRFEDEAKKAHSNIYKVGERVHFRMEVHGVTFKDKATHLKLRLTIKGAAGDVLADFPNFLDKVMRPDVALRVSTVTGDLKIPRPGTFKLEFAITDVYSGRSLAHAEAIVVE
ncbi:MAG: hypothetical protein IT371_04745 [Deltaproteobacteria bacterium]|nr:hypothetical protein [Deltaproteobacteria bacterium]